MSKFNSFMDALDDLTFHACTLVGAIVSLIILGTLLGILSPFMLVEKIQRRKKIKVAVPN